MVEESAQEIKNKLLNNKNKLALKIQPTLQAPGKIFWCDNEGKFVKCITVNDNKQYGKWYDLSDFDELMVEYDPDSRKINYGKDRSIDIKEEDESDLTDKISNKKDISDIVRLKTTAVGRIYLQ
jgi:hypothetical protein